MRKKILLVDDSATVVMMEKMILSKENYDLVIARNGREAVERALAEKPDLVLMDLVMPEMNGLEAVKAIRASGNGVASVPIIMVTTRGEEENIEAGYESGCTDYITKPFNTVELLTKLRSILAE